MSYADHMIEEARAALAAAEEVGDRSKAREAKATISRWRHIRAVVDEAPEFTSELKAQLRRLLRREPKAVAPEPKPVTSARRIPAQRPPRTTTATPVATEIAA